MFCDRDEKMMVKKCQSGEVERGAHEDAQQRTETTPLMPTSENKLIKGGRHVGLDFYDLLIEEAFKQFADWPADSGAMSAMGVR
jgi:hypothetical protein